MFGRNKQENLSINPDTRSEIPETKAESKKLSGSERAASFRKSTWEGFKGVFKKVGDIGKKFVGGFDRVVGKGLETYDTAKVAAAKGAEKVGAGATALAEAPDWIADKVGEGFEMAGEKGADALNATGRGLKKTAEVGVGLGAAAVVGTYEGGKYLVNKGVEKAGDASDAIGRAAYKGSMEAANWMDRKATDGKEFVGQQYESLKGWAGEQAGNIQEKAGAARESFRSGVEKVKGWKNQAMEAYHSHRFESHFAKLSPEAQADSLERLKAIQGGQNLRQELMAA